MGLLPRFARGCLLCRRRLGFVGTVVLFNATGFSA